MAWGLFGKIKKGFKKVGSALKKGAEFVNDKILKPFKPIIKTAGSAIANVVAPGSGALVGAGIDALSDSVDALSNGNYRDAAQNVRNFIQQGRIRTNP